jgi:spermidine synthase
MIRRPPLAAAVCCLGISATVTQLVLMRELLCVLAGNEMVLGIILGNWFLLTGVGAFLGRSAGRLRRPLAVLVAAQVALAVVPVGQVFALRALRNVVFVRGGEIGAVAGAASCLVLLLPYCLVAGYALTLASRLLAPQSRRGILPRRDQAPEGRSPAPECRRGILPRSEQAAEGRSPAPECRRGILPRSEQAAECRLRGKRQDKRQDAASTATADGQAAAGIGRAYVLDVLGGVAGGLAFTFVLVYLTNHFGTLYVPAVMNLLLALAVAWTARMRLAAAVVGLVAVAGAALAACVDLDERSTALQYAGQHVVFRGSSPYGRLVVTAAPGQYDFVENGLTLFTTRDRQRAEQTVHYPMAQRPQAAAVLLISGGASGTAGEVLKYPNARVDYAELDPMIPALARRFAPAALADPRIRVLATDGRLLVRQTRGQYDVIIADVPDPSTSQINRLYTAEFFAEARSAMKPGGVLAVSLSGYENYVSPDLARMIASLCRTLRSVFAHVLVLPGGRLCFLASDGPLTADIAAQIERAGIRNEFVTRDWLTGVLTPDALADLRRATDAQAPPNEDLSPVLYYYHLLYWLRQFDAPSAVLIAVVAAAMGVYLLTLRAVTLAVFAGGLAASALEVVLLVGFQILHGCVYQRVGLIVTMFMLGLAVGGHLANRRLDRWGRGALAKVTYALAGLAALLPACLWGLDRLCRVGGGVADTLSSTVAFPGLALAVAVLVGMAFPLAGKADFRTAAATASRIYTADYVGACAGAMLVSTILIPLIGVLATCLAVAALCAVAGVAVQLTGRAGR